MDIIKSELNKISKQNEAVVKQYNSLEKRVNAMESKLNTRENGSANMDEFIAEQNDRIK